MAAFRMPLLRVTDETGPQLDRIAKRLGMSRSGAIKFRTKSLLDDFERRGTALFPGDWRDVLHSYSGRVARHQHLAVAEDVKGPVIQVGRDFTTAARGDHKYPRTRAPRAKK